jgi:hypothetical protein
MSNIVIPDGGTIGSASDTDAISIPANGKPTFSAGIANTGTIDAGTIGSSVTGNWGWKLLENTTVSSATVTHTVGSATIFSNSYDIYKLVVSRYYEDADNVSALKFLIDGSLVNAGYQYNAWGYDSYNTIREEVSNNNGIGVWSSVANYNSANPSSGYYYYAEFTIANPSESLKHTIANFSFCRSGSGYSNNGSANIHCPTKGALTGIRFESAAGASYTINQGNFKIFGVINA